MKRARRYGLILGLVAFGLLPTASCGSGGGGSGGRAGTTELVRVLISAMDGTEPRLIDVVSHPELFVLDSRIEYVELAFTNSPEIKNSLGPATYMPALTPNDAEPNRAGYLVLSIRPFAGQAIQPAHISFRIAAKFPGNPSSLRVQSSVDGFAGTLSTINTSTPQSLTVALGAPASDADFAVHWQANNDFGDRGGGEAGFATNDIVVTE